MSSHRDGNRVQSLDRAVSILKAFTKDAPARRVAELAQFTGLPASTTHRILDTLMKHGLVQQSRRGAPYKLGPELLRLSYVARESLGLIEMARPVMTKLRDSTGETTALHAAYSPRSRIVLEQVESREELRRTYTDLGLPIPIHQGAPGKLLLAFQSDSDREALLAEPLERATASTITDPSALGKELTVIRRRGFAVSLEERVVGVSTIAVPVRDYTGGVVAAISVSGPATRMTAARIAEIQPLGTQAGLALSAMLGYVPE